MRASPRGAACSVKASLSVRRPPTVPSCRFRQRHRRALAAPRLQDSKLAPRRCGEPPTERRTEHPDHPDGRRRLRSRRYLWRPDSYADVERIANDGISYNAFHTTSICSPTRAALLTGRNHQRVGSGTIAERAVDWDGYTGVIPRTSAASPRSSATTATTLPHSANGTTRRRPRQRRWDRSTCGPPAKASASTISTAFSPARRRNGSRGCIENFNAVEPPHDPKYHLSEDLADKAIDWMREASRVRPRSAVPDVLGAGCRPRSAPHLQRVGGQVQRPVRRRLGRAARRTFKRQKELGWIPADTELTPRADSMAAWESIPESQRPFQRR